jgi:hypothetical protein
LQERQGVAERSWLRERPALRGVSGQLEGAGSVASSVSDPQEPFAMGCEWGVAATEFDGLGAVRRKSASELLGVCSSEAQWTREVATPSAFALNRAGPSVTEGERNAAPGFDHRWVACHREGPFNAEGNTVLCSDPFERWELGEAPQQQHLVAPAFAAAPLRLDPH